MVKHNKFEIYIPKNNSKRLLILKYRIFRSVLINILKQKKSTFYIILITELFLIAKKLK